MFGETALTQVEIRSATVRALGAARVLTVDKETFLRWIRENPSIAYRKMINMSQRIRDRSGQVVALRANTAENHDLRPRRRAA